MFSRIICAIFGHKVEDRWDGLIGGKIWDSYQEEEFHCIYSISQAVCVRCDYKWPKVRDVIEVL